MFLNIILVLLLISAALIVVGITTKASLIKWVLSLGLIYTGYSAEQNRQINHLEELYSIMPDKLENIGIKFPEVFLAQIIVETGFLKSPIYKKCNNVCGMKVPYIRKTYALGSCKGHAYYKSKSDSIMDYLEYQKFVIPTYEAKYGKLRNNEDYLILLQRMKYAEDKLYTLKLKHWVAVIAKHRVNKSIKTT